MVWRVCRHIVSMVGEGILFRKRCNFSGMRFYQFVELSKWRKKMAKLSLKGIVSLSHQIIKDGKTNTHNVDLVQDDFEDCVMLTVEEAKLMLEALLRLPTEGNKAILKKTLIPLKERIEQAEGKDEAE